LIVLAPMKLLISVSSVLVRVSWVWSLNAAVSLILTLTVRMSPTWCALVVEKGARAVAPERIRIVNGRLRIGHGHLHRLVAGLGRWIVDRRQRDRLAELFDPVEGGAVGQQ